MKAQDFRHFSRRPPRIIPVSAALDASSLVCYKNHPAPHAQAFQALHGAYIPQ
jgi:hypothetical protein